MKKSRADGAQYKEGLLSTAPPLNYPTNQFLPRNKPHPAIRQAGSFALSATVHPKCSMPSGSIITALVNNFGDSCSRSGGVKVKKPPLRDTYTSESLRYFRAAANALSETDYETFVGIVSAPAFTLALK